LFEVELTATLSLKMAVIFVVNAVVCLLIGTSVQNLVLAHVYLISSYVVGRFVMRTTGQTLPEGFRVIPTTVLGVSCYMTFLAVVLHLLTASTTLTWVGRIAVWLPTIVLVPNYLRRQFFSPHNDVKHEIDNRTLLARMLDACTRNRPNCWKVWENGACLGVEVDLAKTSIAVFAMLMVTCTYYGFQNNYTDAVVKRVTQRFINASPSVPIVTDSMAIELKQNPRLANWGIQGDKPYHLMLMTGDVISKGFPSASFLRRGVQLATMAPAVSKTEFQLHDHVQIFKVLAFYIWFALLFSLYVIGRDSFKLRGAYLAFAVITPVLFAAINYPPWRASGSTYAGFAKPFLGAFHNSTLHLSMVVAMVGFCFVFSYFQKRTESLWLGMVFIALSFFFKPSLFSIAAPALVVVKVLAVVLRQVKHTALFALFPLFLVPLLCNGYFYFLNFRETKLSPIVRPFMPHFKYARSRLPEFTTQNELPLCS